MPMQVVRQWTSIVAASELARKRNVNDEFLKTGSTSSIISSI